MHQAVIDKDLHSLAHNAQQYGNLLKEHIYKEDNILYPMAEQALSDEMKTELIKEYAETEAEFDSVTIWRKYQSLLIELENGLRP